MSGITFGSQLSLQLWGKGRGKEVEEEVVEGQLSTRHIQQIIHFVEQVQFFYGGFYVSFLRPLAFAFGMLRLFNWLDFFSLDLPIHR